jgi:hypothetical protein
VQRICRIQGSNREQELVVVDWPLVEKGAITLFLRLEKPEIF